MRKTGLFSFILLIFLKKTIDLLFLDVKIINNYFKLLMAVLFVTDLKFMSRRAVSISIWIYDVDFFYSFFWNWRLKMERYEHFKINKKIHKKHLNNVFVDSKSKLSLVFKRENHGINAL